MHGISLAIAERRLAKRYVIRDADRFMFRDMLNPHSTDMRAALLSGPPGTGKTYFSECAAYAIGGKYDGVNGNRPNNFYIYQMHSWTTNEDLHRAPNIAFLAKSASNGALADEPPWIKGILWIAAESSLTRPTVLCLDEIDKCMERSEHLLLEFLESGMFTLPNGQVIIANPDNLLVFITTNETRELHEATLRRVYRHRMEFLPPDREAALLHAQTDAPIAACRLAVDAANKIRKNGLSSPSTKELRYLLNSLKVAKNAGDAIYAVRARLIKQNDLTDSDINMLAAKLFAATRSA